MPKTGTHRNQTEGTALRTRTRTKTLAAALAALAGLAGWHLYESNPTASDTTTATEQTADAAAVDVSALTIAPEDTGAEYDRDDWPHWASVGDGCDVRDAALQDQGRHVAVGEGCTITGQWTSVYDGEVVDDPSELDIDHLVPLAEVARSGARDWSEAERQAYANDPDVLVAVTAASNRAKGDQDPATWLPERDRCDYITRWVAIKQRYDLTADQAEADAIRSVLARCGGGR